MGKLIEEVKFVIAGQATDGATTWNNASYLRGNAINVKNYRHLTVLIIGGAPGGAQGAVSLRQAATDAGVVVGATIVPLKWVYVNTQTAAQSDTWVRTAVVANTFTMAQTNYLNYLIELETAVLTYSWVGLNVVAMGGQSYISAVYILSQPRYIGAEDAPSAIV
jgi:hypothetical protein